MVQLLGHSNNNVTHNDTTCTCIHVLKSTCLDLCLQNVLYTFPDLANFKYADLFLIINKDTDTEQNVIVNGLIAKDKLCVHRTLYAMLVDMRESRFIKGCVLLKHMA